MDIAPLVLVALVLAALVLAALVLAALVLAVTRTQSGAIYGGGRTFSTGGYTYDS